MQGEVYDEPLESLASTPLPSGMWENKTHIKNTRL